MGEARLEVEWDLQSALLAMIANVNNNSETNPKGFSPRDFNPFYLEKRKAQRKRVDSFNEIADQIAPFKKMTQLRKRRRK